MRGRWILNLILLLAALTLGLVIERELTMTRTPPTLSGLVAADLRLIEISRDGEPTIRIERSPAGWQLTTPIQVDADPAQVNRLLAILETPVHRSLPEQAAALGELDLAPARLQLQLDHLKLAFGGIDPIGHYRYVASEGLIHLIDDRFYHLLIAPPIQYVSTALLPRSFTPAFGRLNGVPLAEASLESLKTLVAERIEPSSGEETNALVELKSMDGSMLRFLVSDDRRRWHRFDLRLAYVLPGAPTLTEDPAATDPTPPSPRTDLPALPTGSDGLEEPPLDAEPQDPDRLFAPYTDPEALLPGDVHLGPPPAVRLHPEGEPDAGGDAEGGYGAEPYKERPQGFGQDPFAPDPAVDPDQEEGTVEDPARR